MSIGLIIALLVVVSAYYGLTHRKTVKYTKIDAVLIIPWVLSLLFFVYASFIASEGSCGSANPGPCFGFGVFFGVVLLPLSGITAIIFACRIFSKNRKR